LPKTVAFHAPVQRWFEASFPGPTHAQSLGWPPILAGESTLLLAPTGSGKTLAAFLTAIDRLMFTVPPAKKERCRVLYVSPLKALAVDVERNLRAPLAGNWKLAYAALVHSGIAKCLLTDSADTKRRVLMQLRLHPNGWLLTAFDAECPICHGIGIVDNGKAYTSICDSCFGIGWGTYVPGAGGTREMGNQDNKDQRPKED